MNNLKLAHLRGRRVIMVYAIEPLVQVATARANGATERGEHPCRGALRRCPTGLSRAWLRRNRITLLDTVTILTVRSNNCDRISSKADGYPTGVVRLIRF